MKNQIKNKFKLIDCTLRDGGYYNNWKFSKNLINDFLKFASFLPIDYVELGFRFVKKNDNLGLCAYTTDKFINSLTLPTNQKICVMINCSDYAYNNIFEIQNNFVHKRKSYLDLVRIATHLSDLDEAIKISNKLKSLGYKTAINLMQISLVDFKQLKRAIYKVNASNCDIFYIADSLGSLNESHVKEYFKVLKKYSSKLIGIHTHDNMNNAFSNSAVSLLNGATWIDSSFQGMGRGPGNCKTEDIIINYSNENKLNTYLKYIGLLNDHWFNDLKYKYKWGSNLYYFLAAKYSIHPTYIQTLTVDKKYSDSEIIRTIIDLKKTDSSKFDKSKLRYKKYNSPSISSKNFVLIIGNGKSSESIKKILPFIKKNKPLILGLNYNSLLPKKFIEYNIVSHPAKLVIDIEDYKKNKNKIVLFNEKSFDYASKHLSPKFLFYVPTSIKDHFKYGEFNIVPNDLALTHSLLLCLNFDIKNIFFFGIDGYEDDEKRNEKIRFTIKKFLKSHPSFNINFLNKSLLDSNA